MKKIIAIAIYAITVIVTAALIVTAIMRKHSSTEDDSITDI